MATMADIQSTSFLTESQCGLNGLSTRATFYQQSATAITDL